MKSSHYYVRRAHRYLGLILGVQFLFWTLGGLYFSWTDIDEIHGDFERRPVPRPAGPLRLAAPEAALLAGMDSIEALSMVYLEGRPYYSIRYYAGGQPRSVLADALTGRARRPVGRAEALRLAGAAFAAVPEVTQVDYLTAAGPHHEYRGKPLPAWAVTYGGAGGTTVYVSAQTGRVESFRNNKWRIFDFLWMTHTMDYAGRDNFNNWLLRAFSVFGLVTILSGFLLYWITRRRRRRRPEAVAQ